MKIASVAETGYRFKYCYMYNIILGGETNGRNLGITTGRSSSKT